VNALSLTPGLASGLALRREIAVEASLRYAAGDRRTLDVYRACSAPGAPIIVFFYGGSWQGGNKESYGFVAKALARRGFVMVVPDYRVFPEVRYPAFIEDGALVARFARENAMRFGGDPARVFLMGHSAGAYLAAMLALDSRWLTAAGESQASIAGLIGLAGPYDFLPLRDEVLKTIFGGADRRETQPIEYVSASAPPSFLATGALDRVVDPGNSARLAARLSAAGCVARLSTYRALGHRAILGALALPAPLRWLAPVLDEVSGFVAETSAREGSRTRAGQRALS
jgi:acetyl esterase/lipase